MKHICLLTSCLLISLRGIAQVPYVAAKNAIQIGADYIGIDPTNGLRFRYSFDYRRYLARDRVSISMAFGFANSQRTRVLVPDMVSVGTNTRQRATVDLTASYNLLHSVHHALHIGGGPSAWYRRDDLFVKVDPYPVPSGTQPLVERQETAGWDIGAHGTIEYTYALALNTQVSLHTGATVIGPSGIAPLFGFRAGYRF